MAAATLDAHVTVGFVVKETTSPYLPAAKQQGSSSFAAATPDREQAGRREEGGLGLLRLSAFPTPAQSPPESASAGGEIDAAEHAHLTAGVKRLIKSVKQGLKACQEPEAATEGLGGTYFFMNDIGKKIAIFKPCDEEPLAPNNPKGFVGRQLGDPGLKPTVRVGEAATREVAAYLLDHDHFARVPHTVMVTMSHPAFHNGGAGAGGEGLPVKLGSLQEFVPHDCDTSEMGASRFCARDVHRIGILDIRLMNTDRHAGNMLVRRLRPKADGSALLTGAQYELIPIDHGFALPEAFEPPYFEWQHWPQAMMPFGKEELDYIARLDVKRDIELLRRELPSIREESLRTLEVATTLLKKCAAAGMTLAEIAGVVCRPLIGMDEEPSELEKICCACRAVVDAAADAELSDSEESDGGGSELGGDDVMAMYPLPEAESPTSSDISSTFQMSGAPSGRLAADDGTLFNMDEDVSSRSPPATSPRAAAVLGAAHALLAAKAIPVTPVTPLAAAGPGAAAFSSPLSAVASLGNSLESMTIAEALLPRTSSLARSDGLPQADSAAFLGPASYAPPGFRMPATHAKPRERRAAGRHRRRRAAPTSRLRKTNGQYPPLVEARCSGPGAIFAGLTDGGWEHFMLIVRHAIDSALEAGAWKQSVLSTTAQPPASCPRF